MAIQPTGLPPIRPMIDDEKLKAPAPATPPKPLYANTGPGSGGAPNVASKPVPTGIQPTGLPPRQPNADPTGGKEAPAPGFRQGIQKPNDPVVPRPVGGIPAGTGGISPTGLPNPGIAKRPVAPPGLAKRPVAAPPGLAQRPAGIPANTGPGSMPARRARPVQTKKFDNGYGSQVTPGRWNMR